MTYFISFLEGIITFISPCLLPMLPIYISYFAGENENRYQTFFHTLAFIAGFTCIFVLLGATAGMLGSLLASHKFYVNIISGIMIILLGLDQTEVLHLNIPTLYHSMNQTGSMSLLKSFLFGIIFSVTWTPCVGPFLGAALLMASTSETMMHGILMLLCYSAGLGIPFLFSSVLLSYFRESFVWIKKHYADVQKASGIFLIIVGMLIVFGLFDKLLSVLV